MSKDKQKIYFQKSLLFRKEHFGILALLCDGRRYQLDNNYFESLKFLFKKHTINNCPGLSGETGKAFLDYLINKKIVGFEDKKAKPRFIENNYISKDCITFPRTVYWECSRKCNFNCIHCYSSSENILFDGELSLVQVKKMIRELSLRGTEFLSIGGGEPLMYSHIIEVIKYATKYSVSIEISTNASLVTDDYILQLKKAGLIFVQVSLDGASEEIYSKIRRGGKLSLVVENIKKLSKHFVVSTCMVVNKINYGEVEAVIDLSVSCGATYFRLIPFMEVGRASTMQKLQLEKSEFQKIYQMILYKRKEIGTKIYIQLNENLVIPNKKNISWMPENHYGCSAGRTTCGIDPYGNVYPCSFMIFDKLICGNIKDTTLLEIWKESPVLKMLRSISKLKGKCAKCQHLDLCRGGCRAAAYLKKCDIRDADYMCSIK